MFEAVYVYQPELKIDLIPMDVDQFADPQSMAIRQLNERCISTAMPPYPSRGVSQLRHFLFG
ncbi:hypothetical protein GALL_119100 [mine drainage metagenome]|uniref:Uncharacterized protein n=1 Tax=mine drainage metagenome TaxID=410659 RepID=A0A1J5SC93_9ZZZZ